MSLANQYFFVNLDYWVSATCALGKARMRFEYCRKQSARQCSMLVNKFECLAASASAWMNRNAFPMLVAENDRYAVPLLLAKSNLYFPSSNISPPLIILLFRFNAWREPISECAVGLGPRVSSVPFDSQKIAYQSR
jgi:hypothetical protein